ncbi:MAG TPA: hypothetical protein DCZ49_05785 [Hyphomonadaceae bacterium]|nr:hypothetical protein [Hyphomonadaceae bacterium]
MASSAVSAMARPDDPALQKSPSGIAGQSGAAAAGEIVHSPQTIAEMWYIRIIDAAPSFMALAYQPSS